MRHTILVGVGLLLAAMGLQASVPCPTAGTYATLESMGSCTIGDKTFSDFTFSSNALGGAVSLAASGVGYSVIDTGATAIGFDFATAGLTVSSGQISDVAIGYLVSGPDIVDAAVTTTSLVLGTGISSIAETICPGSTTGLCPTALQMDVYDSSSLGTKLTNEVTFSPTDEVGVIKDLNVIGGTSGVASISNFTDTVSQGRVPEPGFYGLLASGLAVILVARRRREKQAK